MKTGKLFVVRIFQPSLYPRFCSYFGSMLVKFWKLSVFFVTVAVVVLSGEIASTAVNSNSVDNSKEVAGGKIISRNPDDIVFALYNNKADKRSYQVLQYRNLTNITLSNYEPSRETKFLVHGFETDLNGGFPQEAKDAYLNTALECNIIAVDWGKLSTPINPIFYPLAVENVRRVGVRIGDFISWLGNNNLIDLNKIHIVGFSLGAHVAGRAASNVKAKFNQSIARVTGLDPAGPEFYTGVLARKLTPEDAAFVDVYHTSAGQYGILENVGQTDIYLNGGSGPQPGCMAPILYLCSHFWAYKFFTNTIGNGTLRPEDNQICACNDLLGYKLRSCSRDKRIVVGEYLQPGAQGESYVDYRFELEN